MSVTKFRPALLLALVLLLWACQAALASYVPGEVLVRFRPQTSLAAASARHQELGARVAGSVPSLGVQRLWLPPGLGVEEALRRYRALPEVELAQPNYTYRVAETQPNDTFYTSQWHLPRIGAPAAWDTIQGGDIVVAVVDTGVDYDHVDIADNVWPELGYDFINDDPDPLDDFAPAYHGTHIAGIIGAVGNNGIGVSGVCWRVQIMALKALDSSGAGSDASVAAAITFAANQGAQVINLSMESETPGQQPDSVLEEAISYAEQRNILVVCAAGNYGVDADELPVYPGSLAVDNILNVASTTTTDSLADGSDYGLTSVDLAAPGEAIWTLTAGDMYDNDLGGTSMAAAVVSGAAALLLAAHPDLSYRQLKGYLIHYCDDAGLPVLSGGRLDVAEALSAADNDLPWDIAPRSDSGSGGCFIATAAYRSPLAGEVRLLSAFRDRWLASNPLGRPLVAAYWCLSPPAARYIRERPWLPPLVRAALRPALPLVRVSLAAPALLGCLLGTLGIALAWPHLPRRS